MSTPNPMRTCPHCKNTVRQSDAYCSYCGLSISGQRLDPNNGMTPLPKARMSTLGIVGIVFGCLLFLAMVISNVMQITTPNNTAENVQPQKPPFVVESVVVDSKEFFSTVEGVILNNGTRSYKDVEVSVGLYDSSGVLLRNTESRIDNVGSGERWKYSVWSSSNVVYARIKSIKWDINDSYSSDTNEYVFKY